MLERLTLIGIAVAVLAGSIAASAQQPLLPPTVDGGRMVRMYTATTMIEGRRGATIGGAFGAAAGGLASTFIFAICEQDCPSSKTPIVAQRPAPEFSFSMGSMELYRQSGLLVHGGVVWPIGPAGNHRLGVDAAVTTTAIGTSSWQHRRYVHVGMRYERPILAARRLAPFIGARVAVARTSNDSWATLAGGTGRVVPVESRSGGAATGGSIGALAGVRLRISPLIGIVSTASLDYLRLYRQQSTARSWSWSAGISVAQ